MNTRPFGLKVHFLGVFEIKKHKKIAFFSLCRAYVELRLKRNPHYPTLGENQKKCSSTFLCFFLLFYFYYEHKFITFAVNNLLISIDTKLLEFVNYLI